MIQVDNLLDLRRAIGRSGQRGQVGFVPTMGALHEGHAALFRQAREEADTVVASVFVNPIQFAPGEDWSRYPRTPEADHAVACAAGVDVLWFPDRQTLFPPQEITRVSVGPLGERLCGAFRPGHFEGVATVVVKLLLAAMPTLLYLGEKDYQQTVILRRVIADLLLPVTVRVVPTVRDQDGLALSSRNAFLSPSARAAALAIPSALDTAARLVAQGERRGLHLEATMRGVLVASLGLDVEYAELVDTETLTSLPQLQDSGRACIAARVGGTRLIDNRLLAIPPS